MEAVVNRLGRQTAYHVGELSEVAAVRRAGNLIARRLGFDDVRTGQLALIITEAATNIVKHAVEGEILLRTIVSGVRSGVEVLVLDRGPGMANILLRMEDGHSTTGTYGVGLGAIRRLASEFDIYSASGLGTVLLMTLWDGPDLPPPPYWQVGAVCLPIAGEEMCGDAFDVAESDGLLAIALADGLGHGPDAALASERAVALVPAHPTLAPGELLQLAHQALHATRGAAMALASIRQNAGEIRFCGVGNISACVMAPQSGTRRHLLSHNGIVGSNLRKVQEFVHPWTEESIIVLHSDGIGTRWDLAAYAGLASCHASIIAAVLYRDFARMRDDAAVLVVRQQKESA